MKPITRRQALQLGAVGGLGVVIGGIGLSQTGLPWGGRVADGDLLVEPEVLRSSGGLLQVDLVAARREVTIAGRQVQALTYGGTLPGRTWWVRPGTPSRCSCVTNWTPQPTCIPTGYRFLPRE